MTMNEHNTTKKTIIQYKMNLWKSQQSSRV